MMEEWRQAPLPATLEAALAEIRNLRRILYNERQLLAKNVERRVQDARAMAGNLKAVAAENAELRRQLRALHG